MKNVICFVLFLYLWGCPANGKNVVDYVNPFIGTAIKGEGGTVPYIGTPFGMTNFVPQTREGKMGNMPYVYDDEYLEGFLASHKPTIWMGDYGYVGCFFPMKENPLLRIIILWICGMKKTGKKFVQR